MQSILDEKMIKDLKWAEETLFEIIHGGKPLINMEDSSQSWLYVQLQKMHSLGLLSEAPESYVFLHPKESIADEHIWQAKGITTIEPLPKQLTTEAGYVYKFIHEKNTNNVKVLGEDYKYRYQKDALEQINDAASFILTPSDPVGLYQWFKTLNAHIEGSIDLKDTSFILKNAEGFWNPMLDTIKIPQNAAENFFIADTNLGLFKIIRQKHSADTLKKAAQRNKEVKIEPGSTIFSVTGNIKKPQEYDKVMRARGTGIIMKHFQKTFSIKPESAVETSETYIGNNIEKFQAFYKLIKEAYTPELFRQEAKNKGYELETSYVLFDDNGLETNANLTNGPEFSDCTAERQNSYKSFGPGPETKHITGAVQNKPFQGAYGTLSFIKRLEAAYNRKHQELVDAGIKNPRVSKQCGDNGCALICSLKELVEQIEAGLSFEEVLQQHKYFMFSAQTKDQLIFEPRPLNRAMDTKNFTVPMHDPKKRTKAENPNYISDHSLPAQLMKAISRVMGFYDAKIQREDLTARFDEVRSHNYKLASQHSIFAGLSSNNLRTFTYYLQDGNGGFYSLNNERQHEINLEDGSTFSITAPLNNFADLCAQVDGFVFTDDIDEVAQTEHFWERNFFAYSVHVGNQITDKSIAGKPSVFVKNEIWTEHLDVVEQFCGGLIPEMPEHLYKVVDSQNDLDSTITGKFLSYTPHELPEHVFKQGGAAAPSDLFSVTIYCSASSTNADHKAAARHFAFDTAAMGFAIKNGGGTGPDGLMTETSDAVHDSRNHFNPFLKSQGFEAPVNHITSVQCPETEQEEGLRRDNDYWCVWPNIFLRMQDLQNTDAEVVLPGGAGTIQEICASILMRKYGFAETENRPLIIVDSDDIYKPFLKTIPQEDFKTYNIHVVRSEEHALTLLMEARLARGMTPKLPYSIDEYKKLKNSFMQNIPEKIRPHFFPRGSQPHDNQPKLILTNG